MTQTFEAPEALDSDLDPEDAYSNDDHETPDVEDDDTDVEETPEASDPTAPKAAARGLTRGAIRRIAAKAQEISETPDRIVAITAGLLGTSTGLADLTTAVMAAPRTVTTPINDLRTIADSDPMEAGVNAAALGRERIKAVWSLLADLDAAPSATVPAAIGKAAIAVAKAVFALDDIAKAEVEAVAVLLKKN